MKNYRLLKSESGFSLVEVMISLAVLTVVGIGIMQMTAQSLSSSSHVEALYDLMSATDELKAQASKQLTCTLAITTTTNKMPNDKNPELDLSFAKPTGQPWTGKYGKLSVERVFINKITLVSTSSATNEYTGDLQVESATPKMQLRTRKIATIRFSRENAGKLITSCSSNTSNDESPFKGEWVNIPAPGATHQQTCASVGLVPYHSFELGQCVSGEVAPRFGRGARNINFRFGRWGGDGIVGGRFNVGNTYCYEQNKRDNDATDKIVAFLCADDSDGSLPVTASPPPTQTSTTDPGNGR